MKNRVIVFSIVFISLGLTAFSLSRTDASLTNRIETPESNCVASDKQFSEDKNDKVYSDFFYNFGPRFEPVKKSELDNATSITDFLPREETESVVSYKSVSVIIIIDRRRSDRQETGNSDILTENQIKLLRSSEYATDFLIRAEYLEMNKETNELEANHFSPHLTIVPEKQAEYEGGKDALINYLRDYNKENTANLDEDKLRPAELRFTVTKKGKISNIELESTSGYPEMDDAMIELVKKAPGKWTPAESLKGEKVAQELLVSFGMNGC